MEEHVAVPSRKRDSNSMNLKSSLVFFSAGIILILFLFLMGAVPINMLPESSQQQQQQEQNNDESNIEMPSNGGDGDEEGKQQLTTTTESTEEEEEGNIIIPTNTQTKPIEEMNCIELREFAFSFEEGWGSAVALHDERCS